MDAFNLKKDLLEYYSLYCETKSKEDFINYINESFKTPIEKFNLYKEDILKLYNNTFSKNYVKINSNNSSNNSYSEYEVSPSFIIGIFESFQKEGRHLIVLKSNIFNMNSDPFLLKKINNKTFIRSDMSQEKGIEYLLLKLKEYKDCILETSPITYSMINSLKNKDKFYNWSTNNNIKLSSTNSEKIILNNNHYIYDRMVDWKSGYNFYECIESKETHIAPIFIEDEDKIFNIINFSNKKGSSKDDIFNFLEKGICSCGKISYDLSIIPHYKNSIKNKSKYYFDYDLIKRFDKDLINIQFYEEKNNIIEVYYVGDLSNKDKITIKNHFNGFDITYKKDKIFCVGDEKYPIFWNGKKYEIEARSPIF